MKAYLVTYIRKSEKALTASDFENEVVFIDSTDYEDGYDFIRCIEREIGDKSGAGIVLISVSEIPTNSGNY